MSIDSPVNLDKEPTPVEEAPTAASATKPAARPGVWVASTALLIVAGIALGFLFNILLMSPLRHGRDQVTAYANYRSDLANSIAAIGQTGADGALVEQGATIAFMTIPALDMHEVVFEGTTSSTMMSGPGHRRDTVLPGQIGQSIIFGRAAAYGAPFKSIANLQVGDPITIITGQGENTFQVAAVRANGEEPTRLVAGESRVTLVTAGGAPYLPSGLVEVDAVLTSAVQTAPAMVIGPAQLSASEAPMQGDPNAWLGLLLWSQALLLAAVLLAWMAIRWGRWQAWIVAVPVVTAIGVAVTNHILALMPNLL